jgi:hypothetical protein
LGGFGLVGIGEDPIVMCVDYDWARRPIRMNYVLLEAVVHGLVEVPAIGYDYGNSGVDSRDGVNAMVIPLVHAFAMIVRFVDDLNAGDLETFANFVGEEFAAADAEIAVRAGTPELALATISARVLSAVSATRERMQI